MKEKTIMFLVGIVIVLLLLASWLIFGGEMSETSKYFLSGIVDFIKSPLPSG